MKSILLHTDEKKILEINNDAKRYAKALNSVINYAEKVCDTKFTKEQKDNIRDNGIYGVYDYYRPHFPFPNASIDFNLQAMGVSLSPLIEFMSRIENRPNWRGLPIELTDSGFYELIAEPNRAKLYYTYTQNDKQIEAYNLALKITDLINKAIDKGFISNNIVHKIRDFGIITVNNIDDKTCYNWELIKRL